MDKNTDINDKPEAPTEVPTTAPTGVPAEAPVKARRPGTVTAAAIILIVLSLFVAGLGAATQFGLVRGFGGRQFGPGQFRNGNFPPGGFQGNGSDGFQGNGSGGFPGNGSGSGGFQGNLPGGDGQPNGQPNPGNGQGFRVTRGPAGLIGVFRYLRPVMIAFDIIILVLAVVAAIGLFKTKRWAAILAIVLAGLAILLTIPGMLQFFSPLTLAENLVRILLAVAVIVLLLLPSSRKAYAVRAGGEQDEVERVVR